MKYKAFTLYETLVTMIIVGVVAAIGINNMRPAEIENKVLIEAGKDMYIQLDYATREIIARDTNNYTLSRIKNGANEYSIEDSSNLSTLVYTTYKKRIKALRDFSLANDYRNAILESRDDKNATQESLKPSSFTGFMTKNGGYFAVRLHNTCTKNETALFNPIQPDIRTQANSCGQIFFDVNGDKKPNLLGVDQFLVSLTLNGLR